MKRVVITGMGAITPIANSVEGFWKNLTAGVCGIDTIKSMPIDDLPVKIAAEVKDFDVMQWGVDRGSARHADRYTQYAMAAAIDAMKDSGLEVGGTGVNGIESHRLGTYIGSGVGGILTFSAQHTTLMEEGPRRISPHFIPMMIGNMATDNVAILMHAEGPALPIVTACATGTNAIGEAFTAIKAGRADAIIAGGAEAAICPIAIGGFNNCKALSRTEDPLQASIPFDARRNGFVMGDGAGIVILEELEHAQRRGAHIYAEVCGYGNTCDAYHYTAPKPDGSCASRALKLALEEANYKSGERLYINAHGTSTPMNDKCETTAIKLAIGEEDARKAMISSNKSMIGHMLGAAGAVEVIATALTLKEGIVPPTIGLQEADPACDLDYVPNTARDAQHDIAISNSFGFGGQDACVALRKF